MSAEKKKWRESVPWTLGKGPWWGVLEEDLLALGTEHRSMESQNGAAEVHLVDVQAPLRCSENEKDGKLPSSSSLSLSFSRKGLFTRLGDETREGMKNTKRKKWRRQRKPNQRNRKRAHLQCWHQRVLVVRQKEVTLSLQSSLFNWAIASEQTISE